ncbi:Uncharacterized protein PCOAH_00037030 [Plasmodium coatneyi]|uniref:Uncharacterized protein n=1 Tax=Plasmodium coatneyi TaxID=208452 RepID=A0A1B1E258_9APIC|nr:Uncharacterized protein PCOAH_00037030 [Plasmodium coatneyi]ANQ09128.1 Uncharacterized protein PCOAH_00037030 [Plasmodium coatneyi]
MIDNKNNNSRGSSHGFSTGSAGNLNKVNSFLKVFVFTFVILAIQCLNESFSASVQKSSGNGPKVASRLLLSNFDDSSVSLVIGGDDEGSNSNITSEYYYLIVDDNENKVDELGSAENLSDSNHDGDVQVPQEEDVSEKEKKLSREKTYGSNVTGETTMNDFLYEADFMRDCRMNKIKGKLHKKIFSFFKKHHYVVAAVMSIISLLAGNTVLAVGVIVIYIMLLALGYVHKKLK